VEVVAGELEGGVSIVSGALEGRYHLVVGERERARARRRVAELQELIDRLDGQLANDSFTSRAKPDVVGDVRHRLEGARREQTALRAQEESP
jgi:valyl-tRNA synthetase